MATTDEGQSKESQAVNEQNRAIADAMKDREAPKEAPLPTQEVSHEDVRASLRRQGVRPSGNTASGLAASPHREPIDTAIEPEGEQVEDNLLNPRKELSEHQKRPAIFTSNGSIPHGHVATPSGPQPVSVLGPGAAQQGIDASVQGALRGPRLRRRITQDLLSTMSKAEIRAVANDRGYDVPDASGRGPLASAFLKAQKDDESVEEEDDVTARLVSGSPTAPVPASSGGTGTVAPAFDQSKVGGATSGQQVGSEGPSASSPAAESGSSEAPKGPPGGSLS